MKILGELAKSDESMKVAHDKLHSRGVKLLIGSFLALFFGIFITITTGLWPILLVTPGMVIVGARDLIVAHRMKKRQDLLDDFRVLIRPILRDLLSDFDPEKKLRVRFDLTGAADSKQVSKRELPSRFQKLTETVQNDPWCELRMPLADGSTLTLEVVNEYHKFERRYRGRSGKTKWKSKWRKDAYVSASLLPPPGGTWKAEVPVPRPEEKLKAFEKEGMTGKRLERCWSFKGVSADVVDVSPPYKEVVGMMLRLHNALEGGSAA